MLCTFFHIHSAVVTKKSWCQTPKKHAGTASWPNHPTTVWYGQVTSLSLQSQPWSRTAASCCKLQRHLQSQLIGDLSLWHHCCMHLGVKEHDMNNAPVWNMFSHTNKDMRGEKQSEAFLSFHWWARVFCGLTGQHVHVEYNNTYSTCCCLITGPYKSIYKATCGCLIVGASLTECSPGALVEAPF